MITNYDQRTLNKVYTVIRKNDLKLQKIQEGFKKEAKRYLANGDNENYDAAIDVVKNLDFASKEFQQLYQKIRFEFKGKMKPKSKRVKK
jgi:hypothetical protein